MIRRRRKKGWGSREMREKRGVGGAERGGVLLSVRDRGSYIHMCVYVVSPVTYPVQFLAIKKRGNSPSI